MPEMISDTPNRHSVKSANIIKVIFWRIINLFRHRKLPFGLEAPIIDAPMVCLFVRHLDCGSCGACEKEINAILNPVYDAERYGIAITPFPRHAHVLVMTGVMTNNLVEASELSLEVMPERRIVTLGDCTQGSGDFSGSYAVASLPESVKQAIIAHVPGCPPTPEDILRALVALKL